MRNVMIALGVAMLPVYARLMCSKILLVKEHEYVLAGRAAGAGNLVEDGRPYLLTNPLLSFAPGLSIMLVVFAFNMVGDGLRDAFDPRLRGTV